MYKIQGLRVILGSTHPDRYDVLDFLVERHNHLQDQVWKSQKAKNRALNNIIPVAKNYREHIYFVYFVLKLAEREKHPGSIIIFKMVNDPLFVWKEDQSITLFRCNFLNYKGQNHNLLGHDCRNAHCYGRYLKGYSTIFFMGGRGP